MISEPLVPVVLLDEGLLDAPLRQALGASSVQILQATDLRAGVRFLRESDQPMVVLFSVSLTRNALTGLDQVSLLGELLRDEALSRRHAFILVTSTPHEIRTALGRVLERTHVLLLALPLDREHLLSAIWLATRRFAADGTVPLPAGAS